MLRKLLLYFFIAAALLGGSWFLYHLKNQGSQTLNSLHAVSPQALLIWENNNFQKTRNRIAHNSVIWEELKNITKIEQLNSAMNEVDSALKAEPVLSELLANHSACFAVEPVKNEYAPVWIFNTGEGTSAGDFIPAIEKRLPAKKTEDGNLEITPGRFTMYLHFKHNLAVASTDRNAVKAAMDRTADESSILADSSFLELYKTTGKVDNGHIFINTPKVISLMVRTEKPYAKIAGELGGWSALDVSIKSNEWMLNGFSQSRPQKPDFLSLFHNQTAHNRGILEIMPESTAGFVHFGFSNFDKWYQNYKGYLEAHELKYKRDSHLNDLSDRLNINVEKSIASWIESEFAVGYRNDPALVDDAGYFAIFKTANEKEAGALLDQVSDNKDQEMYAGFEIKKPAVNGILPSVLGSLFENFEETHYTIINRYILFSPSRENLKRLINDYLAGRTMENDEDYQKFDRSLSRESNILIYLKPGYVKSSLHNVLHNYTESLVTRFDTTFRNFSGIALQWTVEKERLFYHSLLLRHNPETKKQSHSLWELALDSSLSGKPAVVTNHNTDAKELFVQTHKNTVYLISNTGKILWSKKLEAPIISDIYQIDRYDNNKLQLLFNTPLKLHLIDRLGNEVSGYPLNFDVPASSGISVVDYDQNSDLRIFAGLQTGEILNFNKKGEQVKGWIYKPKEAKAVVPISHIAVKKKDYLITVLEDGSVTALNRRGEERIEFQQKLPVHDNSSFFVHEGFSRELSHIVTADSNGVIYKLNLNNELTKIEMQSFYKPVTFFASALFKEDSEAYFFADTAGVYGYNSDKNRFLHFAHKGSVPQIRPVTADDYSALGVVYEKENVVYLLNKSGAPLPGFPMRGASLFTLTDLNRDRTFNLPIADQSGIFYNYLIKNN